LIRLILFQGSKGAEFVCDLKTDCFEHVFQKGTDPEIDSYSGFFDNGHRKSTGLGDYLKQKGVRDVFVAGLATDYCVKFTALDSVALGFNTGLVLDGCRGVNLSPDDSDKAVAEMQEAGVQIVSSAGLL